MKLLPTFIRNVLINTDIWIYFGGFSLDFTDSRNDWLSLCPRISSATVYMASVNGLRGTPTATNKSHIAFRIPDVYMACWHEEVAWAGLVGDTSVRIIWRTECTLFILWLGHSSIRGNCKRGNIRDMKLPKQTILFITIK